MSSIINALGGITHFSPITIELEKSFQYDTYSFNYDVPNTDLYIDAERQMKYVHYWTWAMFKRTGCTDNSAKQWLEEHGSLPSWDTGTFWNFRVIIFYRWVQQSNGDDILRWIDNGVPYWLDGMTLYRLDGESFPGLKTEGTRVVELDPHGREIIEPYEYLPPDLMKQHKDMHEFMKTHYGKSPQQWEEYQRRRQAMKTGNQGLGTGN